MPLPRFFLALIVSIAGLTGCGGGGGGSATASAAADLKTVGGSDAELGVATVSGVLELDAAVAVDLDTALSVPTGSARNNPPDPLAVPGRSWPQPLLENPVTVRGHVSYAATDRDDYFRVSLSAGQHVLLDVADPERADLDLYLYTESGAEIIDGSLSTGARERLDIISSGEYVLNVTAFSGASNYTLRIEDRATAAGNATLGYRLSDPFVPGELLVQTEAQVSAAAVESAARRGGSDGRTSYRGRLQLWRLQQLTADAKQEHVPAQLRAPYDTLLQVKEVSRQPGVNRVETNGIVRASAIPNDPGYARQWHYPLINLPEAWDMTVGARPGRPVIVAVVDTGLLLEHPDLVGQWVDGYDFVASSDQSLDGDGIDADPSDPGGSSYDPDSTSTFHGSHVAGTIAAASGNGLGGAGVAWQARVMPIRVLGRDSGGTVYDVLQGVRYAAGLENDSGRVPERRADIINLSLTGATYSEIAAETYRQARAAGAIIVAAGGNTGSGSPMYPAAYPGVIGVGAVGPLGDVMAYSGFGAHIDLVAPGGSATGDVDDNGYPDRIYSTAGNPDALQKKLDYSYGYKTGTSMAAAHVAGVIALMEAVDPQGDLTPDEFDRLLDSMAVTRDIDSPGRDVRSGAGLIDAYQAVVAASAGVATAARDLEVFPRQLDLGSQLQQASFRVTSFSGLDLEIVQVSTDVAWLSVELDGFSDDGVEFAVFADRSLLEQSTGAGRVTVQTSAGTVSLAISVALAPVPEFGQRSVGVVTAYLLEETATGAQIRASIPLHVAEGRYQFQLGPVVAGRDYRVVASTDHDADGGLCDAGESCARSELLRAIDGDLQNVGLILEP